ncbi:MAG: helix-turn-helix domain-containing protein [Gemmataceae bacterium]|nr:helix-turn-helix domain-containing protein [Gemmataceae bacterium]
MANVLVRFGERLREVRLRAGVSQERLAELAGLHRTYVSSVERGLRNISLLNIEKLADALGVGLGDLMPGRAAGTEPAAGQPPPPPRSRPDRS